MPNLIWICLSYVCTHSVCLASVLGDSDTNCPASVARCSVPSAGGMRSLLQHGSDVFRAKADRPVFYGICMGRCPISDLRLWLLSLYSVGGWDGISVIASDKPDCIRKVINDTLDSEVRAKVYVKELSGSGERIIKTQKTKAWTNVQDAGVDIHHVSAIIYTDVDIVFGKKLDVFLRSVQGLIDTQTKAETTLALFDEHGLCCSLEKYGGGKKRPYELHTGVVVSFPNPRSAACLEAWGKTLVAKPLSLVLAASHRGVDQRALMNTSKCSGIKHMDKEFILFPSRETVADRRAAEFVHFTTLRRRQFTEADFQDYLKALGMTVHDDDLRHLC